MKFLLALIVILVLISGCVRETSINDIDFQTPDSGRSFLMGVVPNPKGGTNASFDDMTAAYQEAGEVAEVSMVWVVPSGIGEYGKLKQNNVLTALAVYGIKPVVTLNFATIEEVPGEGLGYVIAAPEGVEPSLSDPEFRNLWTKEAGDIARDFQPDYMSLGNEVNDYFHLNPEELDDYLSLVEDAYYAIKAASPGTKVMVVLSYTHLIDNGQWDMLEEFGDRVDMLGLTTYPWKHYDDPEDIPSDYYTRIEDYVSKPIAFTEIGWPSSGEAGSSEEEQASFLLRFVELIDGMNVEMVNWLFLHETELTGIVGSVTDPETATISLKRMDGTRKDIYDTWLDIKGVPYGG